MERIEQEEEDLRLEEAQRAVTTRTVARPAPGVQQAQSLPVASSGSDRTDALAWAVRVVGDLAGRSGSYPGIGWAAGVYELGGETRVYATSNEGMGYIPVGARWDFGTRLVFDPSVMLGDAAPWQGLANPARIVAAHFLRMAAPRPALRLLALATTGAAGEHMERFLGERAAALAEQVEPLASGTGAHRVEAVLPKTLSLAEPLAWWQRWNIALALLRDAVALAALPRAYPQLHEVALALEAGQADWGRIAYVEDWAVALARESQPRRVADDRLGPLSNEPQDSSTVLPQGGVFAYATPFYAARVCVMLSIMLRSRVADEALSAENLADIAYEHYSVSENVTATRNVLQWGPGGQEQRM